MESKGPDAELLYQTDRSGTDKIWKRFCLLPNVQGQKYTFGSTFTTRGEQGEFIFLSSEQLYALNPPDGVKLDAVFEITCDSDNAFWAEPLGGNAIFINGVKTEEKKRLNYGDFLSLVDEDNTAEYLSRVKYSAWGDAVTSFSFQRRELLPEAWDDWVCRSLVVHQKAEEGAVEMTGEKEWQDHVHDQSHDFDSVVGNGLVLSHILSYLPTSVLKEVRFVSQSWNEEAFSLLKKRCTIHFDFEDDSSPTETMKLFRYGVEMRGARMPNFTFKLPALSIEDYDEELYIENACRGKPGDKFISDLDSFLAQGHLQHVKTLKLDGEITSSLVVEQRLKILDKAAASIKHLELDVFVRLDRLADISPLPVFNFKKLQAVTLYLELYLEHRSVSYDIMSREAVGWCESLIPSIHKVTTLRLRCFPRIGFIYLRNLASFQNLEEIVLFTPEDMKWLLKFPRPLKRIRLDQWTNMEKAEDWMMLEELLAKHAKELHTLQFTLPKLTGAGEEHSDPKLSQARVFGYSMRCTLWE